MKDYKGLLKNFEQFMTALLNAVSGESKIYYGLYITLEVYVYSNNMTVITII